MPDPLVAADGTKISTPEQWERIRRPEILELFTTEMFGRSPDAPKDMTFRITKPKAKALGGKAWRKEVTVSFTGQADGPEMHILIYTPVAAEGPAPLFVNLNFWGNHAIQNDPEITLSTAWMRPREGVVDHRATDATRGISAAHYPVETIVSRGYGMATIYCGDLDPDVDDGFQNGVHPLFYREGQTRPAADEWGCIAAWAWGLRRAMDYFETDEDIDSSRVAVMGHSRLGKTALWAGATDERFALVISNNSGCGGASLSRRLFGETVGVMNKGFPHWFCENFKKYGEHESDLPFDQHMLLALMAPRPLYVASAAEDDWCDQVGEFLSCKHADPVYKLLGTEGLPADEMPPLDQPVQGTIGYHIRTGKHAVLDYDWQQYLNFADKHFGR